MEMPDLQAAFAKAGMNFTAAQPDMRLNDVRAPTNQATAHGGFSWSALPGEVAHTVGSVVKGAAKQTVGDFTQAANDLKTSLFTAPHEQAEIAKQQSFLDSQVKALHQQYAHNQISTDQFKSGLKSISDQYQVLSQRSQDAVKGLDTPEAAAGHVLGGAATLATLLSGQVELLPEELAARGALETGVKGAVQKVAGKAIGAVDDLTGAGKTLMKPGVVGTPVNIAGKMVRNGVVVQPTIQQGGSIVNNVQQGHYGQAAMDAGLMAAGAAAPRVLGAAGNAIHNGVYDTRGMYDMVKLANGKTINENLAAAKAQAESQGTKAAMNRYQNMENEFRVGQDHFLQDAKGNHQVAAQNMVDRYRGSGSALKNVSFGDIHDDLSAFHSKIRQYQKDAQAGRLGYANQSAPNGVVTVTDPSKVGAGILNAEHLGQIKAAFGENGSKEDWQQTFQHMADNKQFSNNVVREHVRDAVAHANSYEDLQARLGQMNLQRTTPLVRASQSGSETLDALTAEKGAGKNAAPAGFESTAQSPGYHAIMSDNVTPVHDVADTAPIVQGKGAVFGGIGNALRKMGLSTESMPAGVVNSSIRQNFMNEIDQIPGLAGHGDTIYDTLRKASSSAAGALDARQLKLNEIAKAISTLQVGDKTIGTGLEKDVRSALDRAYAHTALEVRGLGPKATDIAMRYVPGLRMYMRGMNYGHFSSVNPFYSGRVAVKGEAMAQAYGHGAVPLRTSGQNADRVRELVNNALKGGEYSTGEASSEAHVIAPPEAGKYVGNAPRVGSGMIGRIQQNQAERAVAGILNARGYQAGSSIPDHVNEEIQHAVQTIFGYPKDGYLTSNMAKSLNTLVFPSRFETKVAMAAGHYFAQQSPVVRATLAADIANASNWFNSPDGQKWQKDNPEIVGLVNYFTPTETIGNVLKNLSHPGDFHLGDLGEVGGMPFGIITTILKNQGVDLGHVGSDPNEVDPFTGKPYSQTIPDTTKARWQQVGTDLVSNLFSYPGKKLGLDGKTDLVQRGLPMLKPAAGSTTKKDNSGNGVVTGRKLQAANIPTRPVNPESAKPVRVAPVYKASSPKPKRAKVYAPKPANGKVFGL